MSMSTKVTVFGTILSQGVKVYPHRKKAKATRFKELYRSIPVVFTPSQSENESDFHSDLSTSDQKSDVAFALAFTGLGIPLDCCLTCIEVLKFRKEIPSPTPRKYEALRFHLLWTREQR